jgi:hypothetical protein
MDLQRKFDERIALIDQRESVGESDMDIRHEEFQAMANVFLGPDYSKEKLARIEELQAKLHEDQSRLYSEYERHSINATQYVDASNDLLDGISAMCEQILGANDFEALFGSARAELSGFIDKDAFLQFEQLEAQLPLAAG